MEEKTIVTEVLIISPKFIRENSNVSNNMQDKFLQSAIREATNIDFQEIVGTKMLKKIKSLIEHNEINDETNKYYKDLLDVAKYFVMYSAIKRVIVIANIKLDNIGANFTSDDNVDTLGISDMWQVVHYYENQASFYANILQGYCLENYSKLPELSCSNCKQIHPDLHSSSTSHIFLGGARGKGKHKSIKMCCC